jgi:hypothetical protein
VTSRRAKLARHFLGLSAVLASLGYTVTSGAADFAKPLGEPQLERPTLRSLWVYWIVQGDDNENASIALAYRKSRDASWRQGSPLFRVERGAHLMGKNGSRIGVPNG